MPDYSCYVIIENKTTSILKYKDSDNPYGKWAKGPPSKVAAKTRSGDPSKDISKWPTRLADKWGGAGSEGWITYTTEDDCVITLSFQCGVWEDNYAKPSIDRNPGNRYTLSGLYDSGVQKSPSRDTMPTGGHPCVIHFIIDQGDESK